MREDFVSFDLAKKLKEKGFNKKCLGLYVISTKRLVYNVSHHAGEDFTYLLSRRDNDVCIEAPTIYQVLKWLRGKGFDLEITVYSKNHDYWVDIKQNTHLIILKKNILVNSYEEAAIDGIEYVLDNLI